VASLSITGSFFLVFATMLTVSLIRLDRGVVGPVKLGNLAA